MSRWTASLIVLAVPALAVAPAAHARPPGALAGAYDRYGPPPAAAAVPAAAPVYLAASAPVAAAPPLRTFLTWPGKTTPIAPARPTAPSSAPSPYAATYVAPAPAARPVYGAAAYSAPSSVRPGYVAAQPTPAWTSAPPVRPALTPRASAPVQAAPPQPYLFAPAPATPPPAATTLAPPPGWNAAPAPTARATPPRAAPGDSHVRYYSVAREYGMQPDPPPIPPKFFAVAPDLSAPETPDPVPNRAANTAAKTAVNAARLAAETPGA